MRSAPYKYNACNAEVKAVVHKTGSTTTFNTTTTSNNTTTTTITTTPKTSIY